MGLQELQVARREPQPGHVGVVYSDGTGGVLAVRVPAHRAGAAVGGDWGVAGSQARDSARHPGQGGEVSQAQHTGTLT